MAAKLQAPTCAHSNKWHALLCAKCRTRLEWTPSGMVTCPRGHTRLYRLTGTGVDHLYPDPDTGEKAYPAPGTEFDGTLSDIQVEYGRADIVVWCRKCRAVVKESSE